MPNATVAVQPRPKKLIRLKEVLDRFPVSKSTWHQGVIDGKFPKPIKSEARCSFYLESDIDGLIDQVIAEGKI